MILAGCLGGVSLVGLALTGHLAMGLFLLLGLALGALNTLLVQRSVVRFAASEAANRKRRFTMSVLGRLGAITLVAVGCAFSVRPDGLGAIAGLAVFQLIMIGSASVPLLKELRS
jgi:hypothetical protein